MIFIEYVATGSCLLEILFKILEAFEILYDLIVEFATLFCDQYNLSLRNETTTIWRRLGKQSETFMELEYLIGQDMMKVTNFGGGLDPITQHVMNYLRVVSRSQRTLDQVFPIPHFLRRFIGLWIYWSAIWKQIPNATRTLL